MSVHFKHWTDEDRAALKQVRTFCEMGKIALAILGRMPEKAHAVSGPISTGGVGSVEGNRQVFSGVIEYLHETEGLLLWSQMPFESKFVEFNRKWLSANPGHSYCQPILLSFYETVFASGRVSTLHFIHGFESSFGARWEHENCARWNIKRRYLPEGLSKRFILEKAAF